MRYSITLATIPLPLLMWAAWPASPPPVPVKPVATEGVTARRMDEATFRRRWPADLPPALVVHEVPVASVAAPALPPARIVKRTSLRLDICARHGLRRQFYTGPRGWQRWRCRR